MRVDKMAGGSIRHETGRNVFYTRVAIVMLTSWRRWLKSRGTNASEPPAAFQMPISTIYVAAAIRQHPPRRLTTLTYGSVGGAAVTNRGNASINAVAIVSVGAVLLRSGALLIVPADSAKGVRKDLLKGVRGWRASEPRWRVGVSGLRAVNCLLGEGVRCF